MHGLPRGRERLHPGAHRAPRRPAPGDLRRDQGAHPRDRPVGADPQPRLLVLRPLLRGQGVRRQLPRPGRRPRRLDPAAARPRTPPPTSRRCPASRCCSTSTRWPRATSSSPSAAPRSAPTAPCSPTRPTWSATSATRSGSRTSRTGELRADEITGVLGGATWDRAGEHFYYTTVDDVLARRQDLAAPARHRPGRRRAGPPRDRRPVLGRRRPHPQRPVPGDRGRLQDHLRVPLPRRRRPRRRLPGLRRAPRGPGVLPRPRGDRRRGRLPGACTTTPAPTSSSATAPIAPTAAEDWRPLIAHDPAVRLEDVDAFAGHLVVHQRSEGLTQLRILELGADGRRATTTWSSSTTRSTRSARAATRASTSPTSGSATRRWRCRRRSTTTTSAPAS